MHFKEAFKKERVYIYFVTLLGILAAVYLMDAVFTWHLYSLISVAIAVILAAALIFVVRSHRKKDLTVAEGALPEDQWQAMFDRYARRCVNWLLIAFLWVFGLALGLISLGVNSKADEILTALSGNMFTFGVIAFFLTKNLLIFRWLSHRHRDGGRPGQPLLRAADLRGGLLHSGRGVVFWFREDIRAQHLCFRYRSIHRLDHHLQLHTNQLVYLREETA